MIRLAIQRSRHLSNERLLFRSRFELAAGANRDYLLAPFAICAELLVLIGGPSLYSGEKTELVAFGGLQSEGKKEIRMFTDTER